MLVSDDPEKGDNSRRNKLGRTRNFALYYFMRWSVECGHKRGQRRKTPFIPREYEPLLARRGPHYGRRYDRARKQAQQGKWGAKS